MPRRILCWMKFGRKAWVCSRHAVVRCYGFTSARRATSSMGGSVISCSLPFVSALTTLPPEFFTGASLHQFRWHGIAVAHVLCQQVRDFRDEEFSLKQADNLYDVSDLVSEDEVEGISGEIDSPFVQLNSKSRVLGNLVHHLLNHGYSFAVGNEVQHHDLVFPWRFAQTSSQLLQEDGSAVSTAQEDHLFRVRNVNALVELVHCQNVLDFSGTEGRQDNIVLGGSVADVEGRGIRQKADKVVSMNQVLAKDDGLEVAFHYHGRDLFIPLADEYGLSDTRRLPLRASRSMCPSAELLRLSVTMW